MVRAPVYLRWAFCSLHCTNMLTFLEGEFNVRLKFLQDLWAGFVRIIALTQRILWQGGEDVDVSRETPPAPSASNDIFMEANESSSSKLHSSRQSLYLSAQNSEVEGFKDVSTLLKAGDLDLIIDHPPSTKPQAPTIADKPDPYNPSKRKGYVHFRNFTSSTSSVFFKIEMFSYVHLMLFRTAVNLIVGVEQVPIMGWLLHGYCISICKAVERSQSSGWVVSTSSHSSTVLSSEAWPKWTDFRCVNLVFDLVLLIT